MFNTDDNVVEFVVRNDSTITALSYLIIVSPGDCGSSGTLKVCKVAGTGVAVGTAVTFTVTPDVAAPTTTSLFSVDTATFHGAANLSVASTAAFPVSGTLHALTSHGAATMTYTSKTVTTFGHVTTTLGSGTLAAKGVVSSTVVPQVVSVRAGSCTVIGSTFVVGSPVTIAESVPSGDQVTSITTNAPSSDPTLGSGTERVTPGPGVTEVSFTDSASTTGYLEICKKIPSVLPPPAPLPSATFAVGGQTVTVPAGACSPPLNVTAGNSVSVVEAAIPNFVMTACSTVPIGNFVGCNFAARTATVKVIAGGMSSGTILTVTNCKTDKLAQMAPAGSTVLHFTAPSNITNLDIGHPISGPGVPPGAKIIAVNGNSVTISIATTASMPTAQLITIC